MSAYIYHHGIKGQKWGVRRFQNPDGTLTSAGKARKRAMDVNKNMDAVNEIVKTMPRKDNELLILDGDVYQERAEDGYAYVKRFVEKSGDVPISFFDIIGDEKGVAVSIGTRAGSKYRNKGYCSKVAEKGMKWLDAHKDEYDQIVWWARKDNAGSIKIAEKSGFKLDESSVLPDDPWVKYQYK